MSTTSVSVFQALVIAQRLLVLVQGAIAQGKLTEKPIELENLGIGPRESLERLKASIAEDEIRVGGTD